MSDNPYRLPRTIIPHRYELTLEPDLDSATFAGEELVHLDVLEPTDELVLNAAELEIDEAFLVEGTGRKLVAVPEFDAEFERVRLHLEEAVDPGPAELRIQFRGILNDQLRGFYRSTFEDVEGITQTIATTQFESSDARRAFPCWDEPDLKAVFSITLVVPDHLMAVSNGGEVERRAVGDSKVAIRFADTIKLSTYLIAFIVGPLEATEPVDVEGVPLRVVYPVGKGHLTEFALEAGAFCLRYLTDYYRIPYPGDKVDFIAIPDFAFGAMENLGAITYRENLVLADPDLAGQYELRRIADVIGHELAHMWFGDLVTMTWWTGIWLNEAFASFMEMKAVDAYRPDWKRWLYFATKQGLHRSSERYDALDEDALSSTRPVEYEVVSPDDADGMFDSLTYGKGSAVLRMLEQFMGEEDFRKGIHHYLETHRFGNTETGDLWEALESASGMPVSDIMDPWIHRAGHPRVEVSDENGALIARQSRFMYLEQGENEEPIWKVPIIVKDVSSDRVEERRELLEGPLEVGGSDTSALVLNGRGHGFFRTDLEPDLLKATARRRDALSDLEQFVLLDDARAAVLAGRLDAPTFFELALGYRDCPEHATWQMLTTGVRELNLILDPPAENDLARFVRDLAGPLAEHLGWEPREGDSALTNRLRGLVLGAMGHLGADASTVESARETFDRLWSDPTSVDPDIAGAAMLIAAQNGDEPLYLRFFDGYRSAETPQAESRFLFALPEFPDDDLAERTFFMTLDGDIRSQDGAYVVARLTYNKRVGSRVWDLIRANWDRIESVYPPVLVRHTIDYLYALSEPSSVGEIVEFFDGRVFPLSDQHLPRRLEELQVHSAMRDRESDRLAAWLAER